MGVSETIHGQRLQALGLEARLKREQHEQRRQVVREQMIPAMQVVDERRGWQVAAHAHEIEALQLGLACDDKALPSDDRFDIRACPGDSRRSEERRGGKECVRTGRYWLSAYH